MRGIKNNPRTKSFYQMWLNMKSRCNNPRWPHFKDYGGRGIKIWEPWLKFENFMSDLFEDYEEQRTTYGSKECTIDRINNNGNYEPGNIRFVGAKVQNNNRRLNSRAIVVEYNGEKLTLVECSRLLGIQYRTLLFRLKSGWSIEDVLNKPLRR